MTLTRNAKLLIASAALILVAPWLPDICAAVCLVGALAAALIALINIGIKPIP